jgi:hypothetical protein
MNKNDDTKRITVSSLLKEAWHSLTHVEEGFGEQLLL